MKFFLKNKIDKFISLVKNHWLISIFTVLILVLGSIKVFLENIVGIYESYKKIENYFSNSNNDLGNIFNGDTTKVKIAILQFNQYSNNKLEVDKIIKNRLNELDTAVVVKYVQNTESFNESKLDSIAEKLGANIIIYGDYFDNSATNDKISINIYYKNLFLIGKGSLKSYPKVISDISRLKLGYLQEELDYIIFSTIAHQEYFWMRFDAANAYYKKAISIVEKNKINKSDDELAILYFQAGTCFETVDKDYLRAIKYYQKAIGYWKDFYQAYFNIAHLLVYKKTNKVLDTDFYLNKCLKINDFDPDLYILTALNYSSKKQFIYARKELEKAISIIELLKKENCCSDNLKNIEYKVWNIYGDLEWAERKHLDLSKKYYLKAIEKGLPLNPAITYRIGAIYLLENNFRMAQKYLEQSIKVDPYYVESYFALAFCYQKIGKLEDAKKSYLKTISLNPQLYSKELEKELGIIK